MTAAPVIAYQEDASAPPMESDGLSHVSLELGHLYMEDFAHGVDHLVDYFEIIAPYVTANIQSLKRRLGDTKAPRISTCFLIDDYFSQLESPQEVIPMIQKAADRTGLVIDYIARESACAETRETKLAELLKSRLVKEPTPNSTGGRPPLSRTGWLSNGEPSPSLDAAPAMAEATWRPPQQSAPNRHAIFVDVELWDDRHWSCAYLAAVWQCLRLGLLRDNGKRVVIPERLSGPIPAQWGDVPPVLQLTERPQPFSAYRTVSLLGSRFMEIEVATRVVLGQVRVPDEITRQIRERAERDHLPLPADILDRINYTFIGDI
jgi:hypothetical protein